jgi:hypothetical protein
MVKSYEKYQEFGRYITWAKGNRNFNFLSLFINPHKSPYKSGICKVRKSKLLKTIIRRINRTENSFTFLPCHRGESKTNNSYSC